MAPRITAGLQDPTKRKPRRPVNPLMTGNKATILEHLEELRRRIIISVVALVAGTVAAWFFSGQVLDFLTAGGPKPVQTAVAEVFMVQIRLSLIMGLILAIPVIIFQVAGFVLPALETGEKVYLYVFLPGSVLLFALGVAFAYFGVLPFALKFFLGFGGDRFTPVISISSYIGFITGLIIPFGIVFELPMVVLILSKIGLVTPEFLSRQRKFAILIIFVIAAVMTPPDVFSQVVMAGPMIVLYEISIWISRLARKKKPADA